eukprot:1204244-Rhodomonas_salina.2
MPCSAVISMLDGVQRGWCEEMYGAHATRAVWHSMEKLLHMLFRRVGFLSGICDVGEKIFDHPVSTEVLTDGHLGLTRSAVRQFLDVFVVLFRHIDLYKKHKEPAQRDISQMIKETMLPHAMEATKDTFYKLGTHYDVLPGARLSYMHRFSGMYHCISQVAYFHNEAYQRRKHGASNDTAIDQLPVLNHLNPDIPVVFEDENPPANTHTYWRLLSGRVYLIAPGDIPIFSPSAILMFAARNDDFVV